MSKTSPLNGYKGDLKPGMRVSLYNFPEDDDYDDDRDEPQELDYDIICPAGSKGFLISKAVVVSVREDQLDAVVNRDDGTHDWNIARTSNGYEWGGDDVMGFILLENPTLKDLVGKKLASIRVKKPGQSNAGPKVKPCRKTSK